MRLTKMATQKKIDNKGGKYDGCDVYTSEGKEGEPAQVVWEIKGSNKKHLFDAVIFHTSCKVEIPSSKFGSRFELRFFLEEVEELEDDGGKGYQYVSLCTEVLHGSDDDMPLSFTVRVDNLPDDKVLVSDTTVNLDSVLDRTKKVVCEHFLLSSKWKTTECGAIVEEPAHQIKNKKLTFGITVTPIKINGWIPEKRDQAVAHDPVCGSFKAMYASEENFSDITLEAKDKIILDAHKFVLGARSPVFKSMLLQETKKNSFNGTLKIPDVNGTPLKILLHWLYTGELDERVCFVMEEVVAAAKQFELSDLLLTLDKQLITVCTVQNMLDLFGAARKFGMQTAIEDISAFIHKNIKNATLP